MEEKKTNGQQQPVAVEAVSSQVIEQALQNIAGYGGFSLLESVIKGLANMSPERSTRKKIFLTEEDKKHERQALLKRIRLWIDIRV